MTAEEAVVLESTMAAQLREFGYAVAAGESGAGKGPSDPMIVDRK
jgi:hypothetical protein